MRQPVQGRRGRAMLLGALCLMALLNAGGGCGEDGTVVLVTVAGLDSQAMELGVVVILEGSVHHPFPRQSIASSLSASQQFGVLLPLGLGSAVTVEVNAYRGDCVVQTGQAPVALSGEQPLLAKVGLGEPTACAALEVEVQGEGTITSPDVASINCGPGATCMYWVDANRTYALTATPSGGETYVNWLVDGTLDPNYDGQLKFAVTLPEAGHKVKVVLNPLCDSQVTWKPVTGLGLTAGTALRGIWGVAGQEAWAVGEQGTIARYRAATGMWDVVTLKDKNLTVKDTLTGVWGVGSPATLFVVGRGVANGSAFTLQAPALTTGTGTVAVTAATSQNLSVAVNAVSGFDLMNVWTAGAGGSVLKWNPTTSMFEAPTLMGTMLTSEFLGAWVSDDPGHALWTVADRSQLAYLSGSSWTVVPNTGSTGIRLLGVTGTSADVYAVGNQASQVRLGRNPPTTPVVRKVATGADTARTLTGVWAGSGYVFAVGDAGAVFCSRTSGAYWTRQPVTGLPNATFLGVYGSSKRLWVVGQNANAGVVVEGSLP